MLDAPDLSISPLMWIRMTEGLGAIHSQTIMAIIPDVKAPKKRSLIISSAFPEGITVEGDAESLLMSWWLEVGDTPELDEESE
jgi:hypothetical protein